MTQAANWFGVRDGVTQQAMPAISLDRESLERRRHLLVLRRNGGLGDLLMMRMALGPIARAAGVPLWFACPSQYHDVVRDHPAIERLLAYEDIETNDADALRIEHGWTCDVSRPCLEHEYATRPHVTKNRIDLWGEACGVTIDRYDAELTFSRGEVDSVTEMICTAAGVSDPAMAAIVAPRSSTVAKDFTPEQTRAVLDTLRANGLTPVITHTSQDPSIDAPHLVGLTMRELLVACAVVRCVVSVDTGTLHAAGICGTPVAGMFSYISGEVMMRHYDPCVIIQASRSACGEAYHMDCVACYDWGSCPHIPAGARGDARFPLKCVSSLDRRAIESKVSELLALGNGTPRYRIIP